MIFLTTRWSNMVTKISAPKAPNIPKTPNIQKNSKYSERNGEKKMNILPGIAIFFPFVNFYFSPYEFKMNFFDSKPIFSEKSSTLVDFRVLPVFMCKVNTGKS